MTIWAAQVRLGVLISFFLFLGGGHKGEGVDLGRLGSKCDWGALCVIPEQSIKKIMLRVTFISSEKGSIETASHVAQGNLELDVSLRMTWNFWCSTSQMLEL